MSIPTGLKLLSEWRSQERERYPLKGNNLFNVSLQQPIRYLEFLNIVAERHAVAADISAEHLKEFNDSIMNSKTGTIHKSVMNTIEENVRLVQLETESYFIFANLFLDKVSHFIEDYFGSERALSLQSHSKLVKNFEQYAIEKNIIYPRTFYTDVVWLKAEIGHTRDKIITHQKNPRTLHGTTSSGEFSLGFIYPNEKDKYLLTPNVENTCMRICEYTKRLVQLVKRNRTKSRFLRMEA